MLSPPQIVSNVSASRPSLLYLVNPCGAGRSLVTLKTQSHHLPSSPRLGGPLAVSICLPSSPSLCIEAHNSGTVHWQLILDFVIYIYTVTVTLALHLAEEVQHILVLSIGQLLAYINFRSFGDGFWWELLGDWDFGGTRHKTALANEISEYNGIWDLWMYVLSKGITGATEISRKQFCCK